MSWTYVTCSPDIPSRGLLGSGTICLAALGLFGVLFAGGAHAAQETSFAERLEERERAIERHRRAAEETEARIAATEAGIDEDLSSPQTAVRARQRVRARLVDHFVAWDRQRRRLRRAEGQPDLAASADTRALLAMAEPRAHRKRRDDIESMRAIEADLEELRQMVDRRAHTTVELAQHRGEAAVASRARDEVAEQAREPDNRDERQEEAKEAESRLDESLGFLLKNETLYDFHQLRGTLLPPVSGPVDYEYGPRKQDESMTYVRHTGLTWKVEPGTPVEAVGPGMVVFAGRFEGFGKLVIVDHGRDYHTLYAHLESVDVEMSERVERGEPIGESGQTGSFEGPKLYFELRKDGQPVDPTPWFIQR